MPTTNPSILFLVGPTAVGKTNVALRYAEATGAHIISCDALQVYKEMNVVCDKPSAQDQERVVHHGINIVSVIQEFNVAQYRTHALEAIKTARLLGKQPLIVGGSGMYMSVLLDGIFEDQAFDEELRRSLEQQAQDHGLSALHERLSSLDARAASKIHPHDSKRIVRALEIILSTGKDLEHVQAKRQGLWGQESIKIFALTRPREELYRRCEERIDRMFKMGLIDEVKSLLSLPLSRSASMAIGLREVAGYLKGDYDLEHAQYLMKLNTRHFIKRQMTWFRRDTRLEWINLDRPHEGTNPFSHCY